MLRFNISELVGDLVNFLPEVILCAGIVLLLLLRLFHGFARMHLGIVALVVTLLAMGWAIGQWSDLGDRVSIDPFARPETMFSGLLVYDTFTVFLRLFLLSFTALVILLSRLTGIPDREDSADFYVLLLGATLGMSIMSSANHLLMVFMGVEMASLPSYALAGFLKGKRQSSEAALKYVVYGGGASGIMLYGISLLAGKFGGGSLPLVGSQFAAVIGTGDPVVLLGTMFLVIGLAFKLSAVPFHFWCPDVFEGACAEVAGFLSVASKGAALALTGRIIFTFSGLDTAAGLIARADSLAAAHYLLPTIALLAAITATFGNLAAYLQTNLKRLLAYSTIAHAGYMMMGLAPLSRDGVGAVLFYLVAYLFTNLGAFAVVAFLRNQTGSEDLSSMRGLIRRSPILTIALAVFLLSLLGMPPLVGFAAKFQIFSVLYKGGQDYARLGEPGLGYTLYGLLVLGGINTVLSVFYYLKVMKVTIMETTLDEVEGRPTEPLPTGRGPAFYATFLALVIVVTGVLWDPLANLSARGVERYRKSPGEQPQVVAQNPTEGGQ